MRECEAVLSGLVSVIVPVYNTKDFLQRCLDSILHQTLEQLEVLVVDDGSTDGSGQIIAAYCQRDARVHCVTLGENGGLFAARLAGVAQAKGAYIAFVDSDDFVTVDYYRLLYDKAVQTQADIVVADFLLAGEDESLRYFNLDPLRAQDMELNGQAVMDAFMGQRGLFYGWHTIWNKLYRRELWQRCMGRFEAFSRQAGRMVMTEDLAFSALLWREARHVVNLHGVYYCYVQHSGQSIRNADYAAFRGKLENVRMAFAFFAEQCGEYQQEFLDWKDLYIRIWLGEAQRCNRPGDGKKLVLDKLGSPRESMGKSDDFFYRAATDCTKAIGQWEAIKNAIAAPGTAAVSFDLFDTLISRPLLYPTDLFALLNPRWNRIAQTASYVDFAGIRIRAEQRCRQEKNREVTLSEIYGRMGKMCAVPAEQLEQMQRLEIETELRLCTPRRAGVELLELARHQSKRIVVTSDMYLPRAVLEELLKPIPGWQKLYLSCEVGKTKHQGALYAHLLQDLQLQAAQVVHIGDNAYSDLHQAKRQGLQAFLLPRAGDLLLESPLRQAFNLAGSVIAAENAMEFLGIRCLLGVAANLLFDNPFTRPFHPDSRFNIDPVVVGCGALGPHLYGVAKWLLEQEAPRLHFVARDGYLPKLAYDLIAAGKDSNYLFLSRRALLKADIVSAVDLPSLTHKMNALNQSPASVYGVFEDCMTVDPSGYQRKCQAAGYTVCQRFETVERFEEFLVFFGKLVDFAQLTRQNDRLRAYMQPLVAPGDILFDIGYSGRCELAVRQLLGFPVNSCYIHTNSDLAERRGIQGDFSIRCFYPFRPRVTGVLREHLFMQQAGTCLGYDRQSNPVLEDFRPDCASEIITSTVQREALRFVAEVNRFFLPDELPLRELDVSLAYEDFICCAGPKDRLLFASLLFEDALNEAQPICVDTFWNEQQAQAGSAVHTLLRQEDIYIDGVYIKIIRKLNRWFPKGGKARERMKRVAGQLIK